LSVSSEQTNNITNAPAAGDCCLLQVLLAVSYGVNIEKRVRFVSLCDRCFLYRTVQYNEQKPMPVKDSSVPAVIDCYLLHVGP